MRKLLVMFFLLALVGCGKNDTVTTPDHKAQIDENTARIEALEKRVSQLESDLTTTEGALRDEIERLENADDNNLDLIRDEIEDLKNDIAEAIQDLEAEDDVLRRKINRANAKIYALQRRLNRFQQGSNYLHYVVSHLSRYISYVNSNLQSLAETVHQNEEAIEELQDDMENLSEDFEDLANNVENALEDIEEALGDSETCSVDYRNYRRRGRHLRADVYLVCGSYQKRLQRQARIEEEEGEDD